MGGGSLMTMTRDSSTHMPRCEWEEGGSDIM